ncbi:MAG TPA: hypothetical protein DGD08_00070 [Gemmatimonas aurantiaca]|uniref:Uncharacterized protein n=2 Tax=Gemmatimonas aurantiaca TaxID=173480 RepID=C1A4K8_GEMAT|nr:hypothetical protein [Gemmatimonas aurantiaca]BAH37168.1 hypothetical protein GAU_0126 [Gemmatimonas aurantiaca T-27]HCT55584.1 hypothetical protein [Gemmatimonas aurantiaca]
MPPLTLRVVATGVAVTGIALSASLGTSQVLHAQERPTIRQLGPALATSADSLGQVNNIRPLSDGRLLINDAASRRVLLVDSTFKVLSVVADSTPSTANAYGPRSGSLIAYRGDSTLFVDAASLSMLVIDPAGKIARVMSVPRSQDAMMLASAGLGGAYYHDGYLIYRGMPQLQMRMAPPGGGGGGLPQMPQQPDTMAVVRVNLQSRQLDTVGFVKVPKTNTNMSRSDDGKITVSIEVNPLPVVDEWAVTSKGDVALIRGRDYHVDWMSSDKQWRSSAKIPFDWKRLTDEDKVKLIDSVKAIRDRQAAANPNQGQQMAQAFGAAMGGGGGGAAPQVVMRFESRGGGPGGPVQAPQVAPPQINYVSPSELPDYQPPFFATSTRPDADGNIWVRTIPTKPQPAGSVYDVINGQGEAVDRVLIPENRTIIGFAPGGVVFMAVRDGGPFRLERARIDKK